MPPMQAGRERASAAYRKDKDKNQRKTWSDCVSGYGGCHHPCSRPGGETLAHPFCRRGGGEQKNVKINFPLHCIICLWGRPSLLVSFRHVILHIAKYNGHAVGPLCTLGR